MAKFETAVLQNVIVGEITITWIFCQGDWNGCTEKETSAIVVPDSQGRICSRSGR
jgi:hypothetical protein